MGNVIPDPILTREFDKVASEAGNFDFIAMTPTALRDPPAQQSWHSQNRHIGFTSVNPPGTAYEENAQGRSLSAQQTSRF